MSETPRLIPRYPTAAGIERLAAMLHLPPGDQDWEFVVADAARVREFLDTYEVQPLDDDEQFTLMELVVASYDNFLSEGHDDAGHWERIRRHLQLRFDLHGYTVEWHSVNEFT